MVPYGSSWLASKSQSARCRKWRGWEGWKGWKGKGKVKGTQFGGCCDRDLIGTLALWQPRSERIGPTDAMMQDAVASDGVLCQKIQTSRNE